MKELIECGDVVAACAVGRRTHFESRNNDAIHRLPVFTLETVCCSLQHWIIKTRILNQIIHCNGIAIKSTIWYNRQKFPAQKRGEPKSGENSQQRQYSRQA